MQRAYDTAINGVSIGQIGASPNAPERDTGGVTPRPRHSAVSIYWRPVACGAISCVARWARPRPSACASCGLGLSCSPYRGRAASRAGWRSCAPPPTAFEGSYAEYNLDGQPQE